MNNDLEVVRGVYQAFAVGDIASVLAALSPDIHWTEAEGGPYGGVSIGPDAVLENVFMRIGAEWDGFAAIPDEFVADGSTIVALGEYSGTYKATGKSFKAPFAHVWKFKGGRQGHFTSTRTQQYTWARYRPGHDGCRDDWLVGLATPADAEKHRILDVALREA